MREEFRTARPADALISLVDQGLRASFAPPGALRSTGRPTPLPAAADPPPTAAPAEDPVAVRHAAGLMRVNHSGEVAAQALYHGQALVARDAETRAHLLEAAREEGDHLVWCAERLEQLGARPSLLNPVWYAGSAAIGAVAGLLGDRVSLGFVAETERQVEGHLAEHLGRLPPDDRASRAILEQMKADEVRHGEDALRRGGADLPRPVQWLMRRVARVMTRTAYYV